MRKLVRAVWLVPAAVMLLATQSPQGQRDTSKIKYIGPEKCQKCHEGADKGHAFQKWKDGPHAKAFEVLGTDRAKEVAAEHGISDPQKSDACISCHVTAFGGPEKMTKALAHEQGVSCETCHGPGDKHFKARFIAAQKGGAGHQAIPADEIDGQPPVENCLQCHNEKSPTFKPFCFKSRWQKIAHLDPRKNRTAEQIEALKCGCGEDCSCKAGECGTPYPKK
jgi:hypothetical protein